MRRLTVMLLLASLVAAGAGTGLGKTVSPALSPIIFSHALHVGQQQIECLTCHEGVQKSTSASDKNLPTMEVCGTCHDVADEKACGRCHRTPEEPEALPNPKREIEFNHAAHLARKLACGTCHADVGASEILTEANMPRMALCLDCHNASKAPDRCALCHGQRVSLADIHPVGWRHRHVERAANDRAWCVQCHRQESFCLACHRGDNLTGSIHALNYEYTHGLDAKSKEADCARCHDRKEFCNRCHENRTRIPLGHSSMSWLTRHGESARQDVENCASCHDSGDPTCARSGCHRDADGVRGTDAPIHPRDLGRFDSRGPWHDDDGYFCYQCHVDTHSRGVGFCGYCHQ